MDSILSPFGTLHRGMIHPPRPLLFPSFAVVSSSIASREGRAALFVEFNPCAMSFHLSGIES
jgi:hypothetical protein